VEQTNNDVKLKFAKKEPRMSRGRGNAATPQRSTRLDMRQKVQLVASWQSKIMPYMEGRTSRRSEASVQYLRVPSKKKKKKKKKRAGKEDRGERTGGWRGRE
jgi:hypothetical protein